MTPETPERIASTITSNLHLKFHMNREICQITEYTRKEIIAAIKPWVGALQEYGRHAEGCSRAHGEKYRCRCGWSDTGKALAGTGEVKDGD